MDGRRRTNFVEEHSDERGDYLALIVKHGTILIGGTARHDR